MPRFAPVLRLSGTSSNTYTRGMIEHRFVNDAISSGGINEVREYKEARWVTLLEALWRIFSFDPSGTTLSVLQQQLHLTKHASRVI